MTSSRYHGNLGLRPAAEHGAPKTPIRTPSDLRGLKIRSTGGLTADILREIGANPVVLPTCETYTAFQRGIIDAVALGAPDMVAYRLQEIGNYFLPLRLTHTVIQYCLNPRTFDGLPADLRLSLYNLFRLVGQLANINFSVGTRLARRSRASKPAGSRSWPPHRMNVKRGSTPRSRSNSGSSRRTRPSGFPRLRSCRKRRAGPRSMKGGAISSCGTT